MQNSGKKLKLNVDATLVISSLILIIVGILTIYSANITKAQNADKYIKQIIAALAGLVIFFFFLYIEYHRFIQAWLIILVGSVIILLITLIFARKVSGQRSWIFIFGQGFQASEIAKLFSIIIVARYLDTVKKRIKELKYFAFTFVLISPIILLILLQPDLGTAMIYFPVILTMLFISGADKKHLLMLIGTILIGAVIPLLMFYLTEIKQITGSPILAFNKISVLILVAIVFGMVSGVFYLAYKHFKVKSLNVAMLVLMCFSLGLFLSSGVKSYLKKHHYNRFLAFVDKEKIDPRGAGWNISQSLTAIGAGGFNGQGFLKGNQKNGGFLPAQDTDFIFAVIAEEWGFVGSLVIILLFMIIIYRGINVIFNAKDIVGCLIATGITSLFFFHLLINIGMTIGIMPVIGIPLPFLSSGGSFLITCMGSIGLLLNVELRKYVY